INENFVHLSSPIYGSASQWNDFRDAIADDNGANPQPFQGVVEVVPEPSTYALGLMGIAFFGAFRRFVKRSATSRFKKSASSFLEGVAKVFATITGAVECDQNCGVGH
ncbi:MAG: PEP-CTERM sorting domain-containing protein, partial [Solirubrobacterales bacterium]